MRHSEFWEAMDQTFGTLYAKSLAADLVIGKLGSRTASQALDDGVSPREVWDALADATDLTEDQRWAYRDAKPARRRRR
jgi:hypothetical protein